MKAFQSMAYTNYLLFNNVFLKKLSPAENEAEAARFLIETTARDWYRKADLSTPKTMVESLLRPILNQQNLELIPSVSDESVLYLTAPWAREDILGICFIAPYGTDLNGYEPDGTLPKGQHWMIKAVNAALDYEGAALRWVLLTNGDQWRLLDAQSLRRYEAFLEIDLRGLIEGELDPISAYLFCHLFRYEESFERDPESGQNLLDQFHALSDKATEETEKYLKTAVSDNLAIPGEGDGILAHLCLGIVQAIDPDGSKLFSDEERAAIYRDATYLLYRLLFILYAEARSLLPTDREDYRDISLENIIIQSVEFLSKSHTHTESEYRLWDQLSALFNAIYYSDEYLGIPPYNGGLFDDDDKPYLGSLKIADIRLAQAICELVFIPDLSGEKPPGRIDFCDLSVRHLGSLYEGMIEYQLFIAEEDLIARREKSGRVKYISVTGSEQKATDEIIKAGKVYFAQSSHERKATGTHYTTEPLVAKLVNQTVRKMLDERWNQFESNLFEIVNEIEGTTTEVSRERLRYFADKNLEEFVQNYVLSMRICDPAMGSGHFLVYIAHEVANFIIYSLSRTSWENPSMNLDPGYWRRLVTEHCLFGVDINGMATELAKLSLWLVTMHSGRPLSFLDHHLQHGNSLVGVSIDEISQILFKDKLFAEIANSKTSEQSVQYSFRSLPSVIQTLDNASAHLISISKKLVEKVEDIKAQENEYINLRQELKSYRDAGDLIAVRRMGLEIDNQAIVSKILNSDNKSIQHPSNEQQIQLRQADDYLKSFTPFHWELIFPDIFISSTEDIESEEGFDVVIANPPYLGGSKISTEIGSNFLNYLKNSFPPSFQNTDLCAYFLRLGFSIIKNNGMVGFVTTNTISEGDTREGGLQVILNNGGRIFFAERYISWPGEANLEVNLICFDRSARIESDTSIQLDGKPVQFISSWLDDLPEVEPIRLKQNQSKAFLGAVIQGKGFILTYDEARNLLRTDTRYSDCIFPFLVGKDVNQHPKHQSDRYVITFFDWALEKAEEYHDLIQIVREKVKPYRDNLKGKDYREKWWQFGRFSKELREKIIPLERVLLRSRVSESHMLTFVDKGIVYGDATVSFAFDDYYHFALLQSHIHEVWLRRQASSLRTDIRYTPTDCFQTFPFPQNIQMHNQDQAKKTGERYYLHRQDTLLSRQLGLTKTYNLFHDPECVDEDIQTMRHLHAEMDQAILACYGWEDINLRHDFYPNDRKKIRFMPSRDAQREIFIRLIELNQEVAAKEAKKEEPLFQSNDNGDDYDE